MPAPSPLPLGEDGPQQDGSSSDAQARKREQHPPDAPGFFPVSLAFNQTDAIGGVPAPATPRTDKAGGSMLGQSGALTGIDASGVPNDGDSDGYGQPSPRVTALSAAEEVEGAGVADTTAPALAPDASEAVEAPSDHFKAGYGEAPFAPGQRPRPSATQSPWPEEGPSRSASVTRVGQTSAGSSQAPPQKIHFEIRVGDPQKVGDPVTAHIVYTVRTKTTATYFRSQAFSVLRRYSDFRWLHAALVANNPGTFVPPVPEKVKIGRFAPDLVEARRHGLETCINKIAAHPILQKDDDFKLFVESINFTADVKLRDMQKGPVPTPEHRTYFGWSTSINGPKFHETDDWFDHQKAYLDSLEGQLKQVVKASSHLAVQRRELAHAVSEYSMMLINLSGSSLSRSMSTCFAGLGELEKRVQELNESQSDADVRIIGSVMYEYERLVGSIRKAFATRVDAWIAFFKADEDARKAQNKHEKFKKDNRGTGGSHMEHRLHLSHQDVIEADARALTLKRDFDAITVRCKEEMSRFDREKVDDLRRALTLWLDGLIDRQEEIVREWELFASLLTRQTGTNPDPDAPAAAPQAPAAPAPPVDKAPAPADAEQAARAEHAEHAESAQPAEPAEPAQPVEPTEPAHPVEPAEPTEQVEHEEHDEPTEQAEHEKQAQHAELPEPAEHGKAAESADSGKPEEHEEHDEPTQQAEQAVPPEHKEHEEHDEHKEQEEHKEQAAPAEIAPQDEPSEAEAEGVRSPDISVPTPPLSSRDE